MARRKRTRKISPLHRTVEIALGLVMAASVLMFLGTATYGISDITSGRNRDWWMIGFVVPFLLGFAYLTALLAWRLLTGRERRGGGLFPSWVLYLAGALVTWSARGPGWSSGLRSASEENAGDELFDLARSRRQKVSEKSPPKT
jgi:hypothetical protein